VTDYIKSFGMILISSRNKHDITHSTH